MDYTILTLHTGFNKDYDYVLNINYSKFLYGVNDEL